jgi:putative restriction endonuclease
MFDKGSFAILDNLKLIGCQEGSLYIHPNHKLNKSNLEYHRNSHGYN